MIRRPTRRGGKTKSVTADFCFRQKYSVAFFCQTCFCLCFSMLDIINAQTLSRDSSSISSERLSRITDLISSLPQPLSRILTIISSTTLSSSSERTMLEKKFFDVRFKLFLIGKSKLLHKSGQNSRNAARGYGFGSRDFRALFQKETPIWKQLPPRRL